MEYDLERHVVLDHGVYKLVSIKLLYKKCIENIYSMILKQDLEIQKSRLAQIRMNNMTKCIPNSSNNASEALQQKIPTWTQGLQPQQWHVRSKLRS